MKALTIRLICDEGETASHGPWVAGLLAKMPNLKSTRIIMRPIRSSVDEVVSEVQHSLFWLTIPGLSELEISWPYPAKDSILLWDFGKPSNGLKLKWNAELEKMEAPKSTSTEVAAASVVA